MNFCFVPAACFGKARRVVGRVTGGGIVGFVFLLLPPLRSCGFQDIGSQVTRQVDRQVSRRVDRQVQTTRQPDSRSAHSLAGRLVGTGKRDRLENDEQACFMRRRSRCDPVTDHFDTKTSMLRPKHALTCPKRVFSNTSVSIRSICDQEEGGGGGPAFCVILCCCCWLWCC